jgi:hypothetical protein
VEGENMNARQLLYITAGVFALLVLLVFVPVADKNMSLFNSISMLVLGYYFGSSAKNKEVTNEEITPAAPPSPAPAAPPDNP